MSVTYFICISLYFLIYVFKSFTVLLVSAIQQNVLFLGKQNPEQTPTPTTRQNNRGTLSCNSSHVGMMTLQVSYQNRVGTSTKIFKRLLMRNIFKVLVAFVIMLLLFYILAFWPQACGILVPRPGIKPTAPTLEGEVLTTGHPGKSQDFIYSF